MRMGERAKGRAGVSGEALVGDWDDRFFVYSIPVFVSIG
jgi:hypothetical protein